MQSMLIGMLRKFYYLPLNVAFERGEKKKVSEKIILELQYCAPRKS